jgi:hydrogenase-4 component B
MIEIGPLLAVFCLLCGAGIALAAIVPDRRIPDLLAWLAAAASVVLALAGGEALFAEAPFRAEFWTLPGVGALRISLDPLSALFLIVTALVYFPVSIFTAGYMRRYAGRYSLRAFGVMYLGLLFSIVLILVAGDVLAFLLGWEGMAILSYLLVSYEHEEETHAQAGYLMLAMGEAGTLASAVALLLLANAAGSLDLTALKAAASALDGGERWAVFLLSFFGFGVKAGLVPFNSWLPRAHPLAPGNVSAILSGVILNLGIYGIARVNMDILPVSSVEAGLVVLVVGAISAFLGILYATTENDLKAMLAHSSIENLGIVTAGLGAGLVFMAAAHPALAAIAFVAALYHMTNHSIYKALLFLGAAVVDLRAGTRDLDRLGGLIHQLPWTAFFFLVGALSISALPPFNGFASEWLTLQALLRSAELSSTGVKLVFVLSGATLALTAGLAVTCFVKAFAMGFLGMHRSKQAAGATEAGRSMLVPMGVLAAFCLLLGALPTYVIPAMDRALEPVTGASATDALVPPFFAGSAGHARLPEEFAQEFHDLGAQVGDGVAPGRGLVVLHRGGEKNPVVFAMSTTYGLLTLIALLAVTFGVVRWFTRKRRVTRKIRWDGGVRRLLPEMTYTATGFSNPVRVVFDAILRPLTVEDTKETVAEHFRAAIRRSRQDVHVIDRYVFTPVHAGVAWLARMAAKMHHGRVNAYAAYILVALIAFLVIAEFR